MVILEGSNWIFDGSFDSGIDAEDDACNKRGKTGDKDDIDGNVGFEWSNEGNEEGAGVTKEDTEETANDTKDDSFEKELQHDIAGRSANGFADADFASALRDGDEHDVHDADATNEESDAGNESKHTRDNAEHGAASLEAGVAGEYLEGAVAILAFAEFGFDVVSNSGGSVGGG